MNEFPMKWLSAENIYFLEEAKAFERQFGTERGIDHPGFNEGPTVESRVQQMQQSAQRIYEQYLKDDSPMEINIESRLKVSFREIFERNHGDGDGDGGRDGDGAALNANGTGIHCFGIDGNVFQDAQRSVLHLMAHDSLRRFLRKQKHRELWETFLQRHYDEHMLHNVVMSYSSSRKQHNRVMMDTVVPS